MERKGLLGLPPELREQIYEHLVVVKPNTTITMLTNYLCFKSEVSASQPAVSRVNHQLRKETLATFYTKNVFSAQLSDREDLDIAQRWLRAIGDGNVACLRQLTLCGWAKMPRGHCWISLLVHLRDGEVQVEGETAGSEQHPKETQIIEGLKGSFRAVKNAMGDTGFDVANLCLFLAGFHSLCIAL